MHFDLDKLVRDNIRSLVPYSSARSEFGGSARIFLDANENAFGSPLEQDHSRYPDPQQSKLKRLISEMNEVPPSQIFIGNGSDEVIDLLIRVFCSPGVDSILICPPTYGMYAVAAAINDIAVLRAELSNDFELDAESVLGTVQAGTKIIFLCSPNNPTGNLIDRNQIVSILSAFEGIVVVDEAYIHYANARSIVDEIESFPNLVVLQTFSKAWGLAGVRVGLAFANEPIVALLNSIKPPYNVSQTSQEIVAAALMNRETFEQNIRRTIVERTNLASALLDLSFVEKVYESDANFLLIRVDDADRLYRFLLTEKIVVRNRNSIVRCGDCLRITVGNEDENLELLSSLKNYEKSFVLG